MLGSLVGGSEHARTRSIGITRPATSKGKGVVFEADSDAETLVKAREKKAASLKSGTARGWSDA
jgi:hypothetical protein